jgi:anthranilate synthase component 1
MIVTRALPADCDLLRLHRQAPARYPLLLQSTSSSLHAAHVQFRSGQLRSGMGRWDLLLVANGEALRLDRDGQVRDQDDVVVFDGSGGHDFLALLDDRWRALRTLREEPRWPFRGGWALFLAYELAAQVEPVLHLPQAEGAMPVALALRCPAAVLRDHVTGECVAIAEHESAAMLDGILSDVGAADHASLPAWQAPLSLQDDAPDAFTAGVSRILEYLVSGDAFQVNLSRAWHARFAQPLDPAALYARLCAVSPAPFAGLFAGGTADRPWAVVSSSPERLVSVRGDVVETRPIAGTRPRFEGDDDAARIRELVGHPKERAEHVMLIDLERNDLGRVCMPGSVEVDELMTVESYSHVHHIVSNVRGRLRDDATPGATIRAVFPGGTITGCPKVRCMQIIAELEGAGRGAYTGAFGWLNRDGDMDLNILIRSAEVERDASAGSTLRFRTGAGIVADSDPQRELEETRAKARGLLKALGADA